MQDCGFCCGIKRSVSLSDLCRNTRHIDHCRRTVLSQHWQCLSQQPCAAENANIKSFVPVCSSGSDSVIQIAHGVVYNSGQSAISLACKVHYAFEVLITADVTTISGHRPVNFICDFGGGALIGIANDDIITCRGNLTHDRSTQDAGASTNDIGSRFCG